MKTLSVFEMRRIWCQLRHSEQKYEFSERKEAHSHNNKYVFIINGGHARLSWTLAAIANPIAEKWAARTKSDNVDVLKPVQDKK